MSDVDKYMSKKDLNMTESGQNETPRQRISLNGARVVTTTPYAVFNHHSPVYRTSTSGSKEAPYGRVRPFRPRRHSSLPFRPDQYPYANERWSAHLTRDNSSNLKIKDDE